MSNKKLELKQSWLKDIMPEGFPYHESTLISGPGGSGKPLVGLGFVYDWLRNGGNVIFIPLQYPDTKFVKTSLKELYDLNLEKYEENIGYIQFNPEMDDWEQINSRKIKANLLKPEVWELTMEELEKNFQDKDPGTLVLASALNLLLFSPSYKKPILDKLESLLSQEKNRSYLFTVSTSAFREKIRRWEETSDNLMFTEMNDEKELFLRLEKLQNNQIDEREIKVPINKGMLKQIKEVAEQVREDKIPKLKSI